MSTITLEVFPWLTTYFDQGNTRRVVKPYQIEDGETLRGFITRLVAEHPRLGEVAIDPKTGDFGEYLTIVLNDRLLELYDDSNPRLRSGDHVILVPAYIGGA